MVDTIPFNSEDPFGELSDDFHVIRAKAIQAYADLEQSMCRAFGYLAGVTDDVAGIIFFRMVNTRSRLTVLEKLKKIKHGDQWSPYFNSIIAAVKTLDLRRNSIIHWTQQRLIHAVEGGEAFTKAALVPPGFWDYDDYAEKLTADDMLDFSYKCDFFARALNGVIWHWDGRTSVPAWLEIFETPLSYPPPESHLLTRKRPTR